MTYDYKPGTKGKEAQSETYVKVNAIVVAVFIYNKFSSFWPFGVNLNLFKFLQNIGQSRFNGQSLSLKQSPSRNSTFTYLSKEALNILTALDIKLKIIKWLFSLVTYSPYWCIQHNSYGPLKITAVLYDSPSTSCLCHCNLSPLLCQLLRVYNPSPSPLQRSAKWASRTKT